MTGAELRRIRRRLGYTQSEMAHVLKVSREYVNKMERGKRPIRERMESHILLLSQSRP